MSITGHAAGLHQRSRQHRHGHLQGQRQLQQRHGVRTARAASAAEQRRQRRRRRRRLPAAASDEGQRRRQRRQLSQRLELDDAEQRHVGVLRGRVRQGASRQVKQF